ncbi:7,8-dihydropterin-6-yl-methyl-4-(beta-D-ribofuranosyl)aminobenzene 5'-phosphate synthase [Orenia metallireducens]|jgi:7,8-dihydropterin-6-yl-methyl-4-(beta-D-ribofuranosyl)aminobenzene 5'-phosphate synthase|uniref:7,8-dihydropterin-6-yl-methyl-4-(Beta-D-ribofuranosyl)aminobenzene 5'-phosphate synthase n=1 Tax=Orenia metallireducens TaxID=1413210 RepID=A0A285GB08_9FIRM|nr:MBL fold metallo-hydrolase [Orenia metallireducens]PRX24200.1 7,8-dihydropterin-6-yl-methyl-4-(beta-D-ribofuranosyl)aminobenzene 5'-phosphate synthase [Orenia metallireducens]SNY19706.1 7,8-dihydropterin-6-yl-methyl-4-(beta-D-ribofuranosyl)aminobenzene 5'-phosphate synthase [Orenia metallireducens]
MELRLDELSCAKVMILVENRVAKENLLAEHGLSFLISYREKNYLFDTGQGLVLINNMKNLGIKVSDINGVILSHGHYDHGNGLQEILALNSELEVFAHPEVFIPKYSDKKVNLVPRGLKVKKEEIQNFKPIRKATEVSAGLWMTGEIPRRYKLEEVSNKFKREVAGQIQQDNFIDEQAVFIETKKGLVVLLACTHAGVINTLEHIKSLIGSQKIHAIIGGMHLINANQKRINETVSYLAQLNFELIVPLHCTGFNALQAMLAKFKDKVKLRQVGEEFIF